MESFPLFMYFVAASAAFAGSSMTHLLDNPALNRTQIVFSYAGDLWTVNRQGGSAKGTIIGVTPSCNLPSGTTKVSSTISPRFLASRRWPR
jgi:hypothetical protein